MFSKDSPGKEIKEPFLFLIFKEKSSSIEITLEEFAILKTPY